MNFLQLAALLHSIDDIIQFLREKNILRSQFLCCGQECSIIKDRCSDGQIFRCARCRKKKSIRYQSFFSKSQLPLRILLTIVYFFTQGTPVTEAWKHLKGDVTEGTVIQWYAYCREICSQYLLNARDILLGETPGSIVEIDECFLRGKLKYHRGNPNARAEPRILFGMVDTVTKHCVVRIVPDRKQVTLLPIITRYVHANATIHSDEAAMYKILGRMGYTHRTVKHKLEFKAADGTHTNNIENLWSHIKYMNKKIKGTNEKMLALHLDEFIWRWNSKHMHGNTFDRFIEHIAQYYQHV